MRIINQKGVVLMEDYSIDIDAKIADMLGYDDVDTSVDAEE